MKINARITLLLGALLLVCVPVEAQSFSALRREIQKKYSTATHQSRMKAAAALRQHVDAQTLRFAIARVRLTSKDLAGVEEEIRKLSERIAYLDKKIKKARQAGAGNVNQSNVTELSASRNHLATLGRTVKHLRDFLEVLRDTVAAIVADFPEAEKSKAINMMAKAYKQSKDDADQLALARIIVTCEVPEVAEFLNKLVDSRKELDRLRAVIAAESWGGLRAMRLALEVIEDQAWPVRAQSIRVLKQVGGKRAAGFLIDALDREAGRLKTDAIVALKYLTGENYRKNHHLWRKWLNENSHLLSEPTETENAQAPVPEEQARRRNDPLRGTLDAQRRAKKDAGGTGFYGIETTSKHVVYVLDFSGSMSTTGRPGGGRRQGGGGAQPQQDTSKIKLNGKRRIDRLASELIRSVNALSKDSTFNVITFTDQVSSWRTAMIAATSENKQALKTWIVTQGPRSSTNLFGGLEEAFKYAGRGSYDKSYGVAADTIFLLSDGSPTAGRLQKPDEILAEMRKINALKRIAIHGIAIGRGVGALLRRLAAEHDGQFVQIPD